ncbi:MAG: ATP-binding protein [Alphaproteobacteria bacterium]
MTSDATAPALDADATNGRGSEAILNSLVDPVLVVDAEGVIDFVNSAAEQFFHNSAQQLRTQQLNSVIPADSPVMSLVDQVRENGISVSEYGITLQTPKIGSHFLNIQVAPLSERPGGVVISFAERSIAHKIDNSLVHRNAARSVTAMAAMLAHEVKNPLSGIRGAAQLLERNLNSDDRNLTNLICEETDRICALVDRMEIFSDDPNIERTPVNIHQVLEHVRRLAQNGFGRNVRFVENYDPSLPPVLGNRDQMIQVFLNLIKNAVEAAPENGGEIVLSTAFQHGVRLAVAGSDVRTRLPLVASVQDNGEGIPEDLRPHLFDPFVTTKVNGSGLGLALVAKIIGDFGGVIEFDSQPRRTVFRVFLPVFESAEEQ